MTLKKSSLPNTAMSLLQEIVMPSQLFCQETFHSLKPFVVDLFEHSRYTNLCVITSYIRNKNAYALFHVEVQTEEIY